MIVVAFPPTGFPSFPHLRACPPPMRVAGSPQLTRPGGLVARRYGLLSPSRGSFHPTHLPKLELFSGYGSPFFPRRAASAHMTKSLALDPHDLSSRGDLLPSRAGIPPRVASIIWNRNFPSLLSDPSTHESISFLTESTSFQPEFRSVIQHTLWRPLAPLRGQLGEQTCRHTRLPARRHS